MRSKKITLSSIIPSQNKDTSHNVFLYYIICEGKNGDCKNQIYRYDLDNKNNVLVNPKLLLSILILSSETDINNLNNNIKKKEM
jgi:hypothetical protein